MAVSMSDFDMALDHARDARKLVASLRAEYPDEEDLTKAMKTLMTVVTLIEGAQNRAIKQAAYLAKYPPVDAPRVVAFEFVAVFGKKELVAATFLELGQMLHEEGFAMALARTNDENVLVVPHTEARRKSAAVTKREMQ